MLTSLRLITSSGVRRYSGTRLNARRKSSGRDVQRHEQLMPVSSHLCGLTTSESAAVTSSVRSSGQTQAEPAYAASTCSHACPLRLAISATGSDEVADVVPTVATIAHALLVSMS